MNELVVAARELEHTSAHAYLSFQVRDYQLTIAAEASAYLERGQSVIIDLPTGAGKTNAALLIALARKLVADGTLAKVLYIVPNRTLTSQVNLAASWAHPKLSRVAVTEELRSNTFVLRAAVERADVIITTPGLFATVLRRGQLTKAWLATNLFAVVVDEFDEFLVVEHSGFDVVVRFDKALAVLYEELPSVPSCLMSGTVPREGHLPKESSTEDDLAVFVARHFEPIRIAVDESEYQAFRPSARLHLTAVTDPFVSACGEALSRQIADSLRDYDCARGVRIDRDFLMSRLEGIVRRKVTRLPLLPRGWIEVGDVEIVLARRLSALRHKLPFLYDDMFDGIEPVCVQVPLVVDCRPTDKLVDAWRLEDSREDRSTYAAKLRGKFDAVVGILQRHRDDRIVLFTRFTRLSDALEASLRTATECAVYKVDGRSGPRQRQTTLMEFGSHEGSAVLVLTRSTGRRGLDIPAADAAILYSPKEDEFVVWQELSRIRSRVGLEKTSYLLFYATTSEERRVARYLSDVAAADRSYTIVGDLPDASSADPAEL